jgi:hypothetical protein
MTDGRDPLRCLICTYTVGSHSTCQLSSAEVENRSTRGGIEQSGSETPELVVPDVLEVGRTVSLSRDLCTQERVD